MQRVTKESPPSNQRLHFSKDLYLRIGAGHRDTGYKTGSRGSQYTPITVDHIRRRRARAVTMTGTMIAADKMADVATMAAAGCEPKAASHATTAGSV